MGAQTAGDMKLELLVGLGQEYPAGNGSRREGQADLGEEERSLDVSSYPLDPRKGTANQTKHGS